MILLKIGNNCFYPTLFLNKTQKSDFSPEGLLLES
jgi:hypothetical protein